MSDEILECTLRKSFRKAAFTRSDCLSYTTCDQCHEDIDDCEEMHNLDQFLHVMEARPGCYGAVVPSYGARGMNFCGYICLTRFVRRQLRKQRAQRPRPQPRVIPQVKTKPIPTYRQTILPFTKVPTRDPFRQTLLSFSRSPRTATSNDITPPEPMVELQSAEQSDC